MPNNRISQIRFFCDLDHTLIYSHRISLELEKVPVEYLNGKEQSFMTQSAYDFFCNQNSCQLVPVTTRSKAQYTRIPVLQNEIRCKYALVCNGGVLLVDGIEDAAWYSESLSMIADELPELKTVRELVQHMSPGSTIHDVSGLYFYLKHNTPALFAEELKRIAQSRNIRILYDRHKVYCLPVTLNKGTAVDRFAERFGSARTIAAGDSEFDISMLVRADTRIAPSDLGQHLPEDGTILISDSVFSDGICNYLNTIVRKGPHRHE